jgi:hypothetical protein
MFIFFKKIFFYVRIHQFFFKFFETRTFREKNLGHFIRYFLTIKITSESTGYD